MRKILCLTMALFLLLSPALSKGKKAKKFTFDVEAAVSYIRDLSTDAMMGRKSGQPGGVMGEEYIASRFKEWGIEPAGENGTYFQNFTIEHRNIGQGIAFEITTPKSKRNFDYGDDFRVQRYSGSGSFMEDIIFVGYGIHAPGKKYDDYKGVDVKGKVVLVGSGAPQKLAEKLEDEVKMESRVKAALELGARGIIFFRSTRSSGRFYGVRLNKKIYNPDFVLLAVQDNVTDFIFKELKTDLRYLIREINRTSKPRSFNTGVKAFVSVDAIFDEKRETRNVLAKMSGIDKKLKDEYVIIGAHMDHLGVGPLGDVYNGANDNASGSAVVMEIARIMKLNRAKPGRTVIFALWAGEEQGLLGSRHYADHPLFPIEKTIVYLNMDMVGHGSGKVNCRGEYYAPHIWKLLKEKLPKKIIGYVNPGRGGPGGSDHTPFLMKGVPGFAVMTDGYHFKYHRPRDDTDLIKPDILKKTGDFVHAAVNVLASEPGDFILPMRQENFYLKYQTIINFEISPIAHVVEMHKDAKNSHVNLQFAVVEGEEGLTGDSLRLSILKNLLTRSEELKKAKGLSLYSSYSQVYRDIRRGKTTVIPGLAGVDSFRDDPMWADVFSKQGINFVWMDKPEFFFGEEGLGEEGKKLLKALNKSGILIVAAGLEEAQVKVLLEKSKKPLVILTDKLFEKEVMDLIKEKKSALGLKMSKDEDAASYFKKLDQAKEAIGSEHLSVVNKLCLWGKPGKQAMLQLLSEIIKGEYERNDVRNILYNTFFRLLRENREESSSSSSYAYIPF